MAFSVSFSGLQWFPCFYDDLSPAARRYNSEMTNQHDESAETGPVAIGELLRWAEARLAGVANSPRREARLLLGRSADLGDAGMLAFPERAVPAEAATRFRAWVARRARHEPVAHILGERQFRALTLKVSAATLIPRPDTECLVEAALARLPADGVRAVDLGTGSGAIALALADERPGWTVAATERDAAAVAVAWENRDRLGLPVQLHQGSWFEPLADERFDLIVTNPPYVAAGDHHLNAGDLPFEPEHALVSGADGLDAIRHIAATAPAHLHPGGWLMLEHGFDQAGAVRKLLTDNGFEAVTTETDLNKQPRVTLGCRPA